MTILLSKTVSLYSIFFLMISLYRIYFSDILGGYLSYQRSRYISRVTFRWSSKRYSPPILYSHKKTALCTHCKTPFFIFSYAFITVPWSVTRQDRSRLSFIFNVNKRPRTAVWLPRETLHCRSYHAKKRGMGQASCLSFSFLALRFAIIISPSRLRT